MAVVLVSMLFMVMMLIMIVIVIMIMRVFRYYNLVMARGLIFVLKLLAMVVTCTRLFFNALGYTSEHFLLDCQVTYIGGVGGFLEIPFEVLLRSFDNIILLFVTHMKAVCLITIEGFSTFSATPIIMALLNLITAFIDHDHGSYLSDICVTAAVVSRNNSVFFHLTDLLVMTMVVMRMTNMSVIMLVFVLVKVSSLISSKTFADAFQSPNLFPPQLTESNAAKYY